ncbi:FKBP-type peptidyl-prolyl cis-trans isomerase [Alteriqipengyuania sp. 357]
MTEITRVPLRPIAKGSLTKLWIGVIVAIGLAVLLAWSLVPQGYGLTVIEEGEGPNPTTEDVVFVKYTGKLDDGTVFEETQPLPLPPQAQGLFPEGNPIPLENMIPGFTEGVLQMQKGGKYELRIPADQAYGATPPPGAPIPPNADLTFDIELVDFMSRPEFQQRVQVITQMMQEQQGAMMGAPGGAPMPEGAVPPQ